MIEHAVLIAGGGPTGMMLAGELALAGVDVGIVERSARPLPGSRSGGLQARTIEVLDQRGIVDRFLSAGKIAQVGSFASVTLDLSAFPTRHPYGLGLWQNRFEEILAGWVRELGVPMHREREVVGFAQDASGVDVRLADGESSRASYLVGCDGGRSAVRKAAGIAFPGWDPSTSYLIAEAEMREEPDPGLHMDEKGVHAMGRLGDSGQVRIVLRERELGRTAAPTLADLSDELIAVRGTDYGVHNPTWISRFTDMTRQAAAYRAGRVLLAGDAAHVHAPAGGQGLSTGLQDAVNLGWKLAQVVCGTAPERLLDTYHAERHPVGARVQQSSMAMTALNRSEPRLDALREMIADLLTSDDARTRLAARLSGLDIHYDLGDGHPLLGRRMPDLDLSTTDGTVRVYSLLHAARPALVTLSRDPGIDITPWADRVQRVDAEYTGDWELPVLGVVDPPAAVLIRPDGHVAWVGDGTDHGLTDALTTWFGPPAGP